MEMKSKLFLSKTKILFVGQFVWMGEMCMTGQNLQPCHAQAPAYIHNFAKQRFRKPSSRKSGFSYLLLPLCPAELVSVPANKMSPRPILVTILEDSEMQTFLSSLLHGQFDIRQFDSCYEIWCMLSNYGFT
jgi:hypothetical protein